MRPSAASLCAARRRRTPVWRTFGASPAVAARAWRSGSAPDRAGGACAIAVDPRRHRGREEHRLALGGRVVAGSPRCPRRSPCRASRRPRRARRSRRRAARALPRRMWSSARPGVAITTSTPRAQRAQLAADRLPAVDRQHARAERLAVAVHRLGHLHRELARGHEHERDRARRRGRPSARRCSIGSANAAVLPVPVAAWPSRSRPAMQRRDRLALDRRRLLVAERGQRFHDARVEARGRRSRRWRGFGFQSCGHGARNRSMGFFPLARGRARCGSPSSGPPRAAARRHDAPALVAGAGADVDHPVAARRPRACRARRRSPCCPASTRPSSCAMSFSTSDGCSPVVGSSST